MARTKRSASLSSDGTPGSTYFTLRYLYHWPSNDFTGIHSTDAGAGLMAFSEADVAKESIKSAGTLDTEPSGLPGTIYQTCRCIHQFSC